ncbi:MAG: aminopeptidase P family protein [Deltaproteobacteria bacterium]|nr:aminopeptidase P family protein [Deltaproteobacteria bacterium]
MNIIERLKKLRSLMDTRGLAAYLVPSTDPHQSEYVPHRWRRRAFISGFDGSAGTVVVTLDNAGLWTDSRYFLQAEEQLRDTGITLFKMGEPGVPEIDEWLKEQLGPGDRIGLDPAVYSVSNYGMLQSILGPKGISLHPVIPDLVDQVWADDLPALPKARLRVHPMEYAGESVGSKLGRLREALSGDNAKAILLCALDEIAWLFNLRGSDIDYNPVFLSFALVTAESATLFLDQEKVGPEVEKHLSDLVTIQSYEAIDEALLDIARRKAAIWIDPDTTGQRLADLLGQETTIIRKNSPIARWKSIKNEVEIQGMRQAHLRDGVAMVKFLAWLDKAVEQGGQTEISIADKLEEFRSADERLAGLSFETIAGYGPHGAIVHYAANEATNAPLENKGLLLVDSGGQYLDGTTDITRTIALGKPTKEEKQAYTSVLKGHLALANARFPVGTNGYQLDVIARSPLWNRSLNYGHGTGHGVGAFLCVHEGPFSISLRKNLTPLESGQITSNEPGLYKTGEFGIRIENLMLVTGPEESSFGSFLSLEHLTMVPYDLRLIDQTMLNREEKKQVNRYHEMVREKLSPLLEKDALEWLEDSTRLLK